MLERTGPKSFMLTLSRVGIVLAILSVVLVVAL